MQHIRANWLRIWLSTNLPAKANYTRKTSKLAMKKQFACTFISTPWHCAKWQANAAKTVARCRTFWATGQAHKCHTRRMLNVHYAQNFGQNIPTKNELYFKWSQLKPIKFFSPRMTCTIILPAWQQQQQKLWAKTNSTFFLDRMPVNKSFARLLLTISKSQWKTFHSARHFWYIHSYE